MGDRDFGGQKRPHMRVPRWMAGAPLCLAKMWARARRRADACVLPQAELAFCQTWCRASAASVRMPMCDPVLHLWSQGCRCLVVAPSCAPAGRVTAQPSSLACCRQHTRLTEGTFCIIACMRPLLSPAQSLWLCCPKPMAVLPPGCCRAAPTQTAATGTHPIQRQQQTLSLVLASCSHHTLTPLLTPHAVVGPCTLLTPHAFAHPHRLLPRMPWQSRPSSWPVLAPPAPCGCLPPNRWPSGQACHGPARRKLLLRSPRGLQRMPAACR